MADGVFPSDMESMIGHAVGVITSGVTNAIARGGLGGNGVKNRSPRPVNSAKATSDPVELDADTDLTVMWTPPGRAAYQGIARVNISGVPAASDIDPDIAPAEGWAQLYDGTGHDNGHDGYSRLKRDGSTSFAVTSTQLVLGGTATGCNVLWTAPGGGTAVVTVQFTAYQLVTGRRP